MVEAESQSISVDNHKHHPAVFLHMSTLYPSIVVLKHAYNEHQLGELEVLLKLPKDLLR